MAIRVRLGPAFQIEVTPSTSYESESGYTGYPNGLKPFVERTRVCVGCITHLVAHTLAPFGVPWSTDYLTSERSRKRLRAIRYVDPKYTFDRSSGQGQ